MARRKQSRFPVLPILLFAFIMLIVVSVLTYTVFSFRSENIELTQTFSDYRENAAADAQSSQKALAELMEERDSLIVQLSDLEAELEKQRIYFDESMKNSDVLYKQLSDKINQLHSEIDTKDKEIEELVENIAALEKVYLVDINEQFDILNQLTALLENPYTYDVEVETEHEDGTITVELVPFEPKIGIFYQDINNGYTYAYNADEVFDPASMVKAPYILSLLQAASDEEAQIAEARRLFEEEQAFLAENSPQYDEYGNIIPGTEFVPSEFVEPERVFDMTKTIIYTREEYFQEGSGEIALAEDGTEYTYADLFFHVLECSDNVAYRILKGVYGTELYSQYVLKLGAKSLYKEPTGMTARDACKVMKSIYDFTESDAYYASFMKNTMINSRHRVIIPYSVSPYQVAHKYGWADGSYCDMGIVYADNPYVLSILTNYDIGGEEVNEYLQSILKLVNRLHNNFYKQR